MRRLSQGFPPTPTRLSPRRANSNRTITACCRWPGPIRYATPVIVLAMGEIGFPTRVLSPGFWRRPVYLRVPRTWPTAPPPARPPRGPPAQPVPHREGLTKAAHEVYGVIADPVRHSLSPAIHNRAFQARRVDAVYLPFLVGPNTTARFLHLPPDSLPVTGFSVTIHHKQRVIRYLNIVDPLARRASAR